MESTSSGERVLVVICREESRVQRHRYRPRDGGELTLNRCSPAGVDAQEWGEDGGQSPPTPRAAQNPSARGVSSELPPPRLYLPVRCHLS
jgi:hypothetical protein